MSHRPHPLLAELARTTPCSYADLEAAALELGARQLSEIVVAAGAQNLSLLAVVEALSKPEPEASRLRERTLTQTVAGAILPRI